jgi:fucose permease
MASQAFGSFLDIESGVSSLKPVHHKTTIPNSSPPPALELDELQWNHVHTGPATPRDDSMPISDNSSGEIAHFSVSHTPANANDDEINLSNEQESSEILQSWSYSANKWRVLSCCVVYFSNGMSDSAPGALLPYMEKHYNIGYAVVSLIFVAQAIGFLVAAFLTDILKTRLGQAKTYALSEISMVIAFAIIVATPPFPVVVFSFFFIGWAMSINLALSNVYCASLASSTVILGLAQGAYGIGGTIGPIIATSIVSRGEIWSRYYFITLATCTFGAWFSGWSFWNYEQEHNVQHQAALQRQVNREETATSGVQSKGKLLVKALKYGVTLIGALFTFGYQGAEVSISGWVISFLITERKGNPAKVGYVTAGFWVRNFSLSFLQ